MHCKRLPNGLKPNKIPVQSTSTSETTTGNLMFPSPRVRSVKSVGVQSELSGNLCPVGDSFVAWANRRALLIRDWIFRITCSQYFLLR